MSFRASSLTITILVALAPLTVPPAQTPRPRVQRVLNDTTLLLTNGKQWIPGISDLEYFGVLPGSSFAMLGGLESVAHPLELFIWGVGDSLPKLISLYPGPMVDLEGHIYGRARVFVGSCLTTATGILVSFWHSTNPSEPDSAFVYAATADSMALREQLPLTPGIEYTVQAAVKVGDCRELVRSPER